MSEELVQEEFDKHRWCTPPEICVAVRSYVDKMEADIFDPCADPDSPLKPLLGFDIRNGDDGLTRSWHHWNVSEPLVAFVNPPYGRDENPAWAQRIVDQSVNFPAGCIALVPCSPATPWWQHLAANAQCIAFFKKRIHFLRNGEPVKDTTFHSTAFLFEGNPRAFRAAFSSMCTFAKPEVA